MDPWAKDYWGHQGLGERPGQSFPGASRDSVALPTLEPQTSGLQSCGTADSVVWSHPVCGTSLRQPGYTHDLGAVDWAETWLDVHIFRLFRLQHVPWNWTVSTPEWLCNYYFTSPITCLTGDKGTVFYCSIRKILSSEYAWGSVNAPIVSAGKSENILHG